MELVTPGLTNWIAYLAIIGGILLGAWWVTALYFVHSRKQEEELPEFNLLAHLHEVEAAVPVAVIILCTFIGVSMVAYVISVWLVGVSY